MKVSFLRILLVLVILVAPFGLFAQKTCTSNPTTISSNINFGLITWTASGGATVTECNNMADGLITFTGNVVVNLANNRTIAITNDVTIDGNFFISGGPGATLSILSGSTLYVTGDLGDDTNNGVRYNVSSSTDSIIVDGTLYGKNNNAFIGSGSISGGTLDVKNGATCGSPCPVTGGFAACSSDDAFCTTNNVLPVELLYFTAAKNINSVKLSWATASELNFDYFDIEKSSDAKTFHSIGNIQGHGTTNERNDYSLYDEKPYVGKNYYRLKSVDFDGYTEFFKIVMVEFDGSRDFTIYPNPSEGVSFKVETNFEPQSKSLVSIYNALGEEVAHFEVSGDNSTLTLPTKLAAGIYYAKYISAELTSTSRVIVK